MVTSFFKNTSNGRWFFLFILLIGLTGFPLPSYGESSNAKSSVVPDTRQTVEQAKEIARGQKEAIEDHLRKELDDLESQIEQLQSQTQSIREKAKDKIKERLEVLQGKKESMLPRIENLRDSSEQAWKEMKEGIIKAVDDLKRSVDRASKAF